MRQAQLVESRIINLLQFQTLVASKAARVRLAAPDKLLVDFGLRRAHGAEAGLRSARASFIAGFDGTATVLAGMRWGVPLFGTMAHSFIQAHDNELAAFEHFVHSHPKNSTLLIDTYDTEAAARALVPLARKLAQEGIAIQALRIDSGDLGAHARSVRDILDAAGLTRVKIFASSNLDEDTGVARRKRSEGKATWPGREQVFRRIDAQGFFASDPLTVEGDGQPGTPLLATVMRAGRRLAPAPALEELREQTRAQLQRLAPALRRLDAAIPCRVDVAAELLELARQVDSHRH